MATCGLKSNRWRKNKMKWWRAFWQILFLRAATKFHQPERSQNGCEQIEERERRAVGDHG